MEDNGSLVAPVESSSNRENATFPVGKSRGADQAFACAIFVVARMAGWTARYLEELNEPAVRFRALAAYATR